MARLVRAAGREPIERDTFYNPVGTGRFPDADDATPVLGSGIEGRPF
jgi:hypothetical protein